MRIIILASTPAPNTMISNALRTLDSTVIDINELRLKAQQENPNETRKYILESRLRKHLEEEIEKLISSKNKNLIFINTGSKKEAKKISDWVWMIRWLHDNPQISQETWTHDFYTALKFFDLSQKLLSGSSS